MAGHEVLAVQEGSIHTRIATGREILDYFDSPEYREYRAETTMKLGDRFGLDAAKRIQDLMHRKETAVYMVFEHDPLPPSARTHIDSAVGVWMGATMDWEALAAAHAESKGMTLEDFREQQGRKTAEAEPQPLSDPEDAELIPPEHRHGGHLSQMEEIDGLRGTDQQTDSSFHYRRFKLPEEG